MTPKDHVSFNQFSKYDLCPRMYQLEYFENKKKKSNALLWGSFLHEVVSQVNRYIRKLGSKEEMDIMDIHAIYEKEYKKENFSFNAYNQGLENVIKYAEKTFVSRAEIYKIEEEIELPLKYKNQETKLVGRIDRIDSGINMLDIIEFKSSSLTPSKEVIDNDLQLNIYAYCIHKKYPEHQNIITSHWSLATNIKVPKQKDLSKLDKLEDYLIDLWQKIEKDDKFEPKLNDYCDERCPEICQKYKDFIKDTYSQKGIRGIEDAVKMYNQIKTNLNIMTKEKENVSGYLKQMLEENLGQQLVVNGNIIFLAQRHKGSYMVQESDYTELHVKTYFKGEKEK